MPGGRPDLTRIVSGGQTGVDRAALDVALASGMAAGGWCPQGRRAEDGRIPDRYPLTETPEAAYEQRTEWNVRDSDGTLIICRGDPRGGTGLTLELASRWRRPVLVVDLDRDPSAAGVSNWIERQRISTLNVAGPRESTSPGIHEAAVRFLERVLSTIETE